MCSLLSFFIQRVFAVNMGRQTTLINNYLRLHNKPTFNHFTKANKKKIEDISVKLVSNDKATSSKRVWAKAYNNSFIIVRPGKLLVRIFSKTIQDKENQPYIQVYLPVCRCKDMTIHIISQVNTLIWSNKLQRISICFLNVEKSRI